MSIACNTVPRAGFIHWLTRLGNQNAHTEMVDEFLLETLTEFAQQSRVYFETLEELPFTYRERQLAGILIPSFARAADVVFPEQPITRTDKNGKQSLGWVDFWVKSGDYVLLIELKHAYINVSRSFMSEQSETVKISTDCKNTWTTACEQIAQINRREAREFSDGRADNKVIKLALQVMPLWAGSEDWQTLLQHEETDKRRKVFDWQQDMGKHITADSAETVCHAVADQLAEPLAKQAPNWVGLWRIGDKIQTLEAIDDDYQVFPGVAVAARAEFPLL